MPAYFFIQEDNNSSVIMFIKFVRYELLMKNKLFRFRAFQLFIVCTLLFASCKKEGSIGLGIQPTTDLINADYTDTSTVLSFITKEDSVNTNNTDYTIIGSYNDPIFGTASAALFTQWSLPGNQTAIDLTGGVGVQADLKLDSIVLTLEYASTLPNFRRHYGTLEQQTFKVYRVSKAMSRDSTYYSNTKFPFDSLNPIGTVTFIPKPDSLVTIKGIKRNAQLRLKLDSVFGDSIMKQSGTANFASTSAFQTFMKGLCIVPVNGAQASGTGAVFYFALGGGETRLHLYYRRNSTPAAGDTLDFALEINATSSRFTQFKHDFSSTAFASKFDNVPDTDFIYMQSMAGVKTLINFPHLMDINASKTVAINKAELVFKVDPTTVSTQYDTHPQLFLMAFDSTGKSGFPLDYFDFNLTYGGEYDAINSEYKFVITRQLQSILNGKTKDCGFVLLAAGSAVNGCREVMKAAGKNSDKLKLRLTYTKVN